MPHVPRSQLVAYAVIAVAVLALGGRWLAGRAGGGEQAGAAALPAAAPRERAPAGGDVRLGSSPRAAFVHVVGAVRRPGVYRLRGGARVQDALRRAGGATRRANVDAINLAAPVQDGAQIVVPRRGAAGAVASPTGADGGSAGAPAVPSAPVNLNTATEEQLETLDGVGPATAAKILDYRRAHGGFRSVDDLDEVSGIGPKRLAALRDKVTV
jgi:competence protein ComEA